MWEERVKIAGLNQAIQEFEISVIRSLLIRYDGNRSRVADELRLKRTTLYMKLKKYGLYEEFPRVSGQTCSN